MFWKKPHGIRFSSTWTTIEISITNGRQNVQVKLWSKSGSRHLRPKCLTVTIMASADRQHYGSGKDQVDMENRGRKLLSAWKYLNHEQSKGRSSVGDLLPIYASIAA